VRTRVTAALIAALALLAWVVTPALAAAPLRFRAAHGHTAWLTGHPVPIRTLIAGGPAGSATTPAPGLSGASETALIVGGIVVLLALAILVTRRSAVRAGRGAGARPDRLAPPLSPGTAELAAQASRALVQIDDAVLSSEQELGFAIARFGERAAAPFSAAVGSARAQLRDAFRLRQLLDDSAANEATTQSRLAEIRARCAAASSLLDEQAEAFDRLHNIAGSAPQLVAEVDAHIAQQDARLSRSRQVLGRLAGKYTPDAVLAVASNPDQAADRLEFAADSLATARQELAAGDSITAAVLLQAAEAGADQATDLLTGVQHMEAELTQAASAVPAALREVDAEIGEATAWLAERPDDGRAMLVAQARAVSADVRANQAAGAFDALAALRDVQQADAAIDRALAGVRTDQARRQRAMAVLDQAMLVARSSVMAAEDFITTRRGGVGATGRTRLAEGQRHFRQAIGCAQSDPDAALTEAQYADALAQQARALAEQDVAQFDAGELSPDVASVAAGGAGDAGGAGGAAGAGPAGAGAGDAGASDAEAGGAEAGAAPAGVGIDGAEAGSADAGGAEAGAAPAGAGTGGAGADAGGVGAVAAAGLRGAILGGILIDSGADGIGPGSFGGVGTRGRRGLRGDHRSTGQHSVAGQHTVTGHHTVTGQQPVTGQRSSNGERSVSGRV
jgi:hypothetical protein